MPLKPCIYLDYNATTPVHEQVLEAMLPYYTQHFGNPSSNLHRYGWVAEQAVENAKQQVSNLIGAKPSEIIFTSGATESINLAIKGLVDSTKKHIVSCTTEHSAVIDTLEFTKEHGFTVTYVDVNREGKIDVDQFEAAFTKDTLMACIMLANNETGTIHPVEELCNIAHAKQALFFCDATQALGKLHIDVRYSAFDMLAMSAHKIGGPKGIGGLFVNSDSPHLKLQPLIHGGGQQRGLRSGTLNVPGIVGFGRACVIAQENLWLYGIQTSKHRTQLEQAICEISESTINGDVKNRLSNTSNLCFHGWKAADIIRKIPEIAVSTASACHLASGTNSHVLKAMGLSEHEIQASIRFSIGMQTTDEDIKNTIIYIERLFQ